MVIGIIIRFRSVIRLTCTKALGTKSSGYKKLWVHWIQHVIITHTCGCCVLRGVRLGDVLANIVQVLAHAVQRVIYPL